MFVRNLPYSCTDAGLEEAFGEIGPVKECFIIADKKGAGGKKGSKRSKKRARETW